MSESESETMRRYGRECAVKALQLGWPESLGQISPAAWMAAEIERLRRSMKAAGFENLGGELLKPPVNDVATAAHRTWAGSVLELEVELQAIRASWEIAEAEIERLRIRQRNAEDQLCRISSFLGKDATKGPDGDRTIAGVVIAEIERLRGVADKLPERSDFEKDQM